MRTHRRLFFLLLAAGPLAVVAACGSRTGLLVPVEHDAGVADTGGDAADAFDSTLPDVAEEPDAVEEPDAIEEPDTFIPFDAPDECPDAGSTLIYVITTANVLMSFYPPTASFNTIGTISCPDPGSQPFSMAVTRGGIAYVLFQDGNLFQVSTKTAACQPTPFNPTQGVFPTPFGMGFSADMSDAGPINDAGETLYLAGDPGGMVGTTPVVLGSLDTTTFLSHPIATVTPPIFASELTGTGSGQLFGFYLSAPIGGSMAATIGQIDKTTAHVTMSTNLPAINIGGGWAFAFWGGDFYTFTAPDTADTVVQRYRPSDGSVVTVAGLTGLEVVGAGVSTCAPQM